MNKKLLAIAALALVTSAPAMAAGGLSLRGAAYVGNYHFESNSADVNEGSQSYGGGLGANVNFSRFFADLGVDFFDIHGGDTVLGFVRSDVTLTGGVIATSWLSPYVGYRHATQDTGKLFDDDVWTEDGYYVGTGIGPFGMGSKLWFSTSLAYNVNKVSLTGGPDDLDYNGISVKLKLGIKNSPHAVEMRAQRFEGEDTGLDFKETYAYLGYVFTWRAATF